MLIARPVQMRSFNLSETCAAIEDDKVVSAAGFFAVVNDSGPGAWDSPDNIEATAPFRARAAELSRLLTASAEM